MKVHFTTQKDTFDDIKDDILREFLYSIETDLVGMRYKHVNNSHL